MEPSTVSMASLSEMALSRQSRRQVPSMPMMQTPYPRLNVTRSGPLASSVMRQSPAIASCLRHSCTKRRHPCGCRARTAGPIETAALRIGLEDVGQPDHRFGCAEHEKAVRFGHLGKAVEYVDLGVLIEIDQNVAAEDHVESSELGKIVQQIQLPMLNHRAEVRIDLPQLSRLFEVFDEHLNRQAALHLELAIYSRLGLLEHLLRKVGGDDFDPPAAERAAHFLQAHRQRIRFLTRRAGGAPDPNALATCARPQDFGHDRIAKMIERNLVAEEEGLVDSHGLDHLGGERGGSAPHFLHEFADAGQTGFPRKREQPAFDQILIVGRQVETGMVLEKFAQVFIVWRGHGQPLEANWKDFRLTSDDAATRIPIR